MRKHLHKQSIKHKIRPTLEKKKNVIEKLSLKFCNFIISRIPDIVA